MDKTTSVWNQTLQACSRCADFTGTRWVHTCMGHTHGTHVWDCATLSPVWIVVVHCTLYVFTNFAMTGHDKVNDAYKMPQPTETSRPELIGCLSLKHPHIHWWQTLLLPCSEIQPKVKRPWKTIQCEAVRRETTSLSSSGNTAWSAWPLTICYKRFRMSSGCTQCQTGEIASKSPWSTRLTQQEAGTLYRVKKNG